MHWRFKEKSTHLWSLDADRRLNQPCCARATWTPSESSSAKSAVPSDLCSSPYEPLNLTQQQWGEMGKAELGSIWKDLILSKLKSMDFNKSNNLKFIR